MEPVFIFTCWVFCFVDPVPSFLFVPEQLNPWKQHSNPVTTFLSNVSCSYVCGGHPTCFLHWDIHYKKKKKDKLMRATLLKEGNCACALQYVNALVARSTLYRLSLASKSVMFSGFSFFPSQICTCECKDLQPDPTVAPTPASPLSTPDSAKGWVVSHSCHSRSCHPAFHDQMYEHIHVFLLMWGTRGPVEFHKKVAPLVIISNH